MLRPTRVVVTVMEACHLIRAEAAAKATAAEVEAEAETLELGALEIQVVATVMVQKVALQVKRAVQQTLKAPNTPPRTTDKPTDQEAWGLPPMRCNKPCRRWEVEHQPLESLLE